ncbi:MAG: DUF1553 domain-containing protein [Terriglobia bacterium]
MSKFTKIRKVLYRLLPLLLLAPLTSEGLEKGTAPETKAKAPGVDFNRAILPILSDRCFACHGPDKNSRKTALRFDTEEGAMIDLGEGKHAIVRGQPDQSEMIRRVTSDDEAVRMPPAYAGHGKLSDPEISLLRQWISQGAPWQKHWAFIPPQRPPLPAVKDKTSARNPIDYFVLQRLDKEGLHPAPEADRATLLRRLSLDLTGLPPTPEEIDAFLADKSSKAYERQVDRLLQSPRYGERMAIRWLDAARYADTNGYQSDGPRDMWRWRDWVIEAYNRNLPFDQFTIWQIAGDMLPNATGEQVIATGFNRNHRTSAEGGIIPEEFRTEYVADRVQTTTTVWLGLTMGCARCHDHKFDPLKQKEFYQLFAYFNNVPEKGFVFNFGNEPPLVKAPTPKQEAQVADLDRRIAEAEQRFSALKPELQAAQGRWESSVAQSPEKLDWSIKAGLIVDLPFEGFLTNGCYEGKPAVVGTPDCQMPLVPGRKGLAATFDGKRFIDGGDVAKFAYNEPYSLSAWIYPTSPTGAIITHIEDLPQGEGYGLYLLDGKIRFHFTARWTDLSMRLETAGKIPLNRWQHVLLTYDGKRKAAGIKIYVDGVPQNIDVIVDEIWPFRYRAPFRVGAGEGPENRFHGYIDEVKVYDRALSPEEATILPVVQNINEIIAVPPAQRTPAQSLKLTYCFLNNFSPDSIWITWQELIDLKRKRERLYDDIQTVMVMKEGSSPRDTFVLKRGAYDNPGEKVSPGVPAVLPPLSRSFENNRLGFARWLVDPGNPLTARVMVNRLWQQLFGIGLVKTVEDFGNQGERPQYQDLLDWLAVEFVRDGWDTKAILKTIVTSATYRQSSVTSPELLEKDPDNRLLARGARVRLPAEVVRDQALAISGLLVEKFGGPSVKPYQPPGLWEEVSFGDSYKPDTVDGLYRRSLYTYWKRTITPPSMVTFDATDRETCTVRLPRTNTPLQALNLMNDVVYLEASRKLAERMVKTGGNSPEARIAFAFRLATARFPQPQEQKVLMETYGRFLDKYRDDPKAALKFLNQGESEVDETLDPKELASYATVASLILNLDETITKQ